VAGVLGFVALLVGGALLLAWVQFNRIERVAVADVLSPGGAGTNYLIVGSDSREGIEADDPNAGAFIAEAVDGARTDTIMVLRVEDGRSRLLSLPRDLWVQNAVTGEYGRINSTYASGPAALIQTVQQGLGIPVHHYLEIDFLSFGALVDAVGGITVEFPNPARDDRSGLLVEQPGPATLDGAQALAYVRSRAYTEQINGVWQADPTGDIGRTERQRQFLTTLLADVGATRNPFAVRNVLGALGGGLRIDDSLTFWDALRLGWQLKGLAPESVDLPVYGRTTGGGASVLELAEGSADVVAQFNG
jgi:LCP family protein required for cell wall assembly